MNGYILTSKSLLKSDIWRKPPNYLKVWMYLLLNAQYGDYGNLKRGQLFVTIQDLIDECTYYAGYRKVAPSKKEIYRILEWLRCPYEADYERETNDPMIVTTKVTHGMVVTICNYNDYQDPKKYERESEVTTNGSRTSQRKGDKGNNIKNENKKNKEEKDILSSKLDDAEKIISYLNKKTGRSYRADTKQTLRMINARLEDGYTLEDFYKVIDNQVARWSDTDMADYLRPNTLFAPKHFDEYLNAPQTQAEKQDAVVRENIERAKRNIEECKTRIAYLENKINEKSDFSDFEERRALIDKRTGYEQVLKQNERYLREHKGG